MQPPSVPHPPGIHLWLMAVAVDGRLSAVTDGMGCRRFNLPQPERFVLIILQFHPYLDRGSAAGADAAQRGRWTAHNEVIRL